jgi:hypothetical protein
MLDGLPTQVRDLLVALVPVLLGWVSTDVVPPLEGVNPLAASLVAVVVAQLAQYFTTLTRAYGVGKGD